MQQKPSNAIQSLLLMKMTFIYYRLRPLIESVKRGHPSSLAILVRITQMKLRRGVAEKTPSSCAAWS